MAAVLDDERQVGAGEGQRNEEGPVGQARGSEYRLPPLVCLGPQVRPILSRLIAAGVVGAAVAILFVAGMLLPAPGREPTGRQLRLPVCGFLVSTGYPCPTCGMTRAFGHVVRGQLVEGFVAQPMGALVCLGVMLAVPAGLVVLVTGRGWRVDWYRVRPDRLLWGVLAVFLAAWGYKVLVSVWGQCG